MMTLLLGPPSSGKTTLLLALAGKLDKDDVKVSGKITYNGQELKEFAPKRTCAYVGQHDLHYGEMTVRETLDFSARCLGVGAKQEVLNKVPNQEDQLGIQHNLELDAFSKGSSANDQNTSVVTDYVLKILGLDMCANTIAGDDLRRGISGGEKKRLTIGEMLVGPAKFVLINGISTGLDSSTTFKICKYIREMIHKQDMTTIISLLQPSPETYELFDDVILLSEGQIVYQGPRELILEFFEYVGFKCPERKGVADFLQEVTSIKDQEQYWFKDNNQPYGYVSVSEFVQHFESFRVGRRLKLDIGIPYDKSKAHPDALVKDNFGISNWKLLIACFSREWLLMKRNSFLYIFKSIQITILSIATMTAFFRTTMHHKTAVDGQKYLGAMFFSLSNFVFNGMAETTFTIMGLPIFYKQRDSLFYPAWAYALPVWVLRIPISLMESAIWTILTYYTIGYAPTAYSGWLSFVSIKWLCPYFD